MVLFALTAVAPSPFKKIEAKTAALQKPVASAKAAAIEPPKTIEPKPFDVNDRSTWPVCPENQIVWAQDGICHEKAAEATSVAQTSYSGLGSGDCDTEIAKYDWSPYIAHKVMMQESTGNPGTVNDTPATGDYSIGCFQINIYGANARSRPDEATLKIASENVAYAYKLWVGSRSFWGHWPNTCRKVGCE